MTEEPNPERQEPPYADQPAPPGPGYAPPGPGYAPPGPPQPKATNPAVVIVLVVLASLLVLCCIGGSIGGFLVYRATKDVVPARDATKAFISDLRSRNAADAYQHLCAPTRAAFTPPEFTAIVAAQPEIIDYKLVRSSTKRVNGQPTATVTADLNLETGRTERHTFTLAKERGNWLICGTPY